MSKSISAQPDEPHPLILGHKPQEAHIAKLFQENHLPHALLLTGPKGIGKGLFAKQIAAFLLTQSPSPWKGEDQGGGLFGMMEMGPPPGLPLAGGGEGLSIALDHPIFRRIAAGSHPDFLLLRPEFDEKKKEFKAEIPVEEARRIGDFMSLTPSEGAWRVAVIDSVDELNRNAANALLKVLEEPPAKAILILVSHNPAQLLPTIRSRCQVIAVTCPTTADFQQILQQKYPEMTDGESRALALLSDLSPGRAIPLHEAGAMATYGALIDWARQYPNIGLTNTQSFIDAHLKKDGEQSWRMLGLLIDKFLTRLQKSAADCQELSDILPGELNVLRKFASSRPLSDWFTLWEKAIGSWSDASRLYLDKRMVLQQILFDLTTPLSKAA